MIYFQKWENSASVFQLLLLMFDAVNSMLTFQNIVTVAVIYYATSICFNLHAAEHNEV